MLSNVLVVNETMTIDRSILGAVFILVGAMIGSFINVVCLRLPRMMKRDWYAQCCELLDLASNDVKKTSPENSNDNDLKDDNFNLAVPASHCPKCKHNIRWWENIPVLSYLWLRGKCSQCKQTISLRYPIIESLSALLSLIIVLKFGLSTSCLMALLFTWSLLVLTVIDIDEQLLPDDITLPLLWLGLLANYFGLFTTLPHAIVGAMAGYLSLWSVYWLFKLLTGKEGMGYGDFKLLAALGAWLGWQALPIIIILSSVVGTIIGLSLIIFQGRDSQTPIPFGPYLAIAGWITLMWGDGILQWYSGLPLIM